MSARNSAGKAQTPEFGSPRAIFAIALCLALVESGVLLFEKWGSASSAFFDTDDALRLVQVRALLAGRGWYDQVFSRIDPPQGMTSNWSRLVDAAEAGFILFLRVFFPDDTAELIARETFPLLLLAPAIAAALILARNLGAKMSVMICAALLAVELLLYRQFQPGRLDHHDFQIMFMMVVLAAATLPSVSKTAGIIAGVATALGLAVGLEALPFQIIAGILFAVRYAFFGEANAAFHYGWSIAAATAALFLVQTPPHLWGVPFCDALAINLVIAVAIAGFGMAVLSARPELSRTAKVAGLAALGIVSAIAYLAVHPSCVKGPFADIDPGLKTVWLDRVNEMLPLWNLYKVDFADAVHGAIMMIAAAVSLFVIWKKNGPWPARLAMAMVLPLAILVGIRYARAQDYLFWFGIPAMAAALSYTIPKYTANRVLTVVVSLLFCPLYLTLLILMIEPVHAGGKGGLPASCGRISDYKTLAALQPGLVLADLDAGPMILVNTPHSVLTAPYHRLSSQLIRIANVEMGPSEAAEMSVRGLKADYVVDCTALSDKGSGFFHDLRGGKSFGWLTKVSAPGDVIQIWRVNPR